MKIDIARLSEELELEVREEWDPSDQDLNAPGLEFDGFLRIAAYVKKDGSMMLARIQVEGKARLMCARCSKRFESLLSHSFRLAYPIDIMEKQQVLDEHVREELILAYPAKILCRDDCRGLCLKCGADLNDGVCMCKRNQE
jgi:uncharacterized protein